MTVTLQNFNKYRSSLFSNKFCQTKTAFGNEKVPKVSIEAGCQVSLVGHHIDKPAVFCVSGCPNFPNKKCSPYFSRLSSANSTQYKSFRVELKMRTRNGHIVAQIEHLFHFLTQVFVI